MFRKYNFEKGLKFSIRKFSVGVASVAIGSLLFISPQVLADETTSVTSATTPTGVTATDANLVTSNNSTPTSTNRSATSTQGSNLSNTSEIIKPATLAATSPTTDNVAPSVDKRTYATSGDWTLQNPYADSVRNKNISPSVRDESFKSAETTVVRDDNSTVKVTATITPVPGNDEGSGVLTNGGNQSEYKATSEMFVGNVDPAKIPALGVYTQPGRTEGGSKLSDKLNFNGKAPSTILTLKFDKAVTDPIIDLSGVGGNAHLSFTETTNENGRIVEKIDYARGSYNSTFFELITPGISLEKASSGVNLTVTANTVDVTDKNTFNESVVNPSDADFVNGLDRTPDAVPAGTGSIRLKGTFTEVSFKLYHQAVPFTAFSKEKYHTGDGYYNSTANIRPTVVKPDSINGLNKHASDVIDDKISDNNDISNDDLLRLSVRLQNPRGSVVVNYIDTEGNIIGTEYKDTTDAILGTHYNTAESSGDLSSDATVERPFTITKDGKVYELVAENITVPVGKVNSDGTLATNGGSFNYGTDAASGEVADGTKSVTYVYSIKQESKGNVHARYIILGTETELASVKTVKSEAPIDEAYSDRAPATLEKDGKLYEFVHVRDNKGDAPADGKVTEQDQTITYEYVEVPKGRVVVDYVIEGTATKLKDTYVDTPTAYIRDKEGQATPYNTAENDSEKPLLLDKDGIKYELVSIQEGSAAEKGTLREGEQHVVYQYRKVVEVPSVKVGNVHARYVILGTETELASVKTVKSEAPIDEAYSDRAPATLEKDGKLYEFVHVRDNKGDAPADGKVTEQDQTITYEYKLKKDESEAVGNVVINYVDETGNVIKKPILDTHESKVGTPYDTTDYKFAEIKFNGKIYKLVSAKTMGNEFGKVTEGTTEVTYVYRESVKSTLPKEMGISIPSESESPKFISTQTTENRPNKGVLTSSKKPTNKSVLPTTGEESNRTLGVVGITLVATTATLAASSLKRRKN
ncbi:YSIRK-type signal peptide-containing protein [Streptococcus sp. FDAARGOS_521]|uniref:MucBP domain-containing protein n=1 Tax=Streptococcus sp. FDAARGOS_521 TaxID=2420309 RepID=UPI000F50A4D1|nr:MucBP domain-containing protein [Streptococcus sp. FDAARGOS_521]AYY68459.1 YSIRK-type signal peptide-containing protein [Streptococcus sp. FDAARGOS_521]